MLKVKVAETSEAIEDKVVSVTGYFPLLQEDETYTFYGKTATHPKFGLQFQAEHFKKKFRPQKKGSFTIYQVICLKESEKNGGRNRQKLGDGALNKILTDASVLYDVPKMSKRKRISLPESCSGIRGLSRL